MVKVLAIRNPLSYLVCAGIKDVENRTWRTDYRGELYIHSCGDLEYFRFGVENLKALDNFDRLGGLHGAWLDSPKALEFLAWELKFYGLEAFDDEKDCKIAAKERGYALKAHAIIGKVDLVDIVEDSNSPWAFDGQKHWILENAVLFDKPIEGIEGRLRIFEVDV